MANQTLIYPTFFILGDGASLTFVVTLSATPLLFDKFSVVNFPKNVSSATVIDARDSLGNVVTAQVSVNHSGSAVTLSFTVPFSDTRVIQLQLGYNN
jgi:hypothetical protein